MTEISIIATSHIAKESAKEIEDKFNSFNPDIIAIELDKGRYIGLTSKNAKTNPLAYFRVGLLGGAFALVASYGMKYLGKGLGVNPGVDMKKGISLAKKNKIELALIDQDINITLRKISNLPFKKKVKLVLKMFTPKKHGIDRFDLNKVPDAKTIAKMMKFFEKELPDLYNILVHERNVVMAHNLIKLAANNQEKKILVIIGAGHKEGIIDIIAKSTKTEFVGQNNSTKKKEITKSDSKTKEK